MTAFHEMPSAFHNGIIATDNDTVSSTAVTIMTTVFDGRTGDNDLDLYFDTVFHGRTGNNDNNYGDITASNSNIVTIIVAVAAAINMDIDIDIDTSTDEAPYDYYYRDAAVSIASSSI
eukprot:CAMPEP_0170924046 /NCGR_PEP_ID=MMETSP0735-20130129/11430_1 /TAXON_ID=186038 /ORGANISM="Fragilariopsis kerguelensis, Strain L26-C5" /LENGTH=117 /DNA_ID=CAMNT_0011323811 /DNA_START=584 /DNA_END=934 /DNA_ORIENTATION=+